MTRGANTDWRAWAESQAAGFSRFSLFSLGAGESGRMRENQNAILPHVRPGDFTHLRASREKRENSSQLHTCAGAARGNRELHRAEDTSVSPEPPWGDALALAERLWTSLVNKEDVYAIAYRLALPPSDPVDAWRLAALRVAKSEAFMQIKPSHVPLRRADWQRWTKLQESPRKMFDLLRKLIYGVRIWD